MALLSTFTSINSQDPSIDVSFPDGILSQSTYLNAGVTLSTLGSVVVDEQVTTIETFAFENATRLLTVVLGSNVQEIEGYAFYNTPSLETLKLPPSFTTIDGAAFNGSSISTLNVSSNNTMGLNEATNQTIGSKSGITVSFYGTVFTRVNDTTQTITIIGPLTIAIFNEIQANNVKAVSTNSDVTSIESLLFNNSSTLESIVLSNTITSIGANTFNNSSSLSSVTFTEPCLITTFESAVFAYTTSLQTITIPSSVTSINQMAFQNSGLSTISIPNTVLTLGEYVFSNSASLTSVVIGNGITSIPHYAFNICTSLTSVTIGNSVTSIGTNAFQFCIILETITIPSNVTIINEYAFDTCASLTNVILSEGLLTIGDHAFGGSNGNNQVLTSLTIPNSVTYISNTAFSGLSALTKIYVEWNNNLGLKAGIQSIGGKSNVNVIITNQSKQPIKHNLIESEPINGEPKIFILNNSISHARSAMPLKDLTTDNSNLFSMTRNKYVRTKFNYSSPSSKLDISQRKKWYGNNNNNSASATSNYYQRRVNFPSTVFNINQQSMSYTNNFNVNYVQQSLQKTRSGGSRVPLKVTQKNIE